MMPTLSDERQKGVPRSLFRLFIALLGSESFEALALFWRLAKRVLSVNVHGGMYEVLDYEARLELQDPGREKAILHKRMRVRFLQDNIIAYQDQAWGDGHIFADYKCSPGVEADRYREGHRYRILISLRGTKNRNDVENFHIERAIKQGFRKPVEDLQIEIDHLTRHLTIVVVFPHKRPPQQVTLIEKNTTRRFALGTENRVLLPDGRQQYRWTTKKPRLFEGYILRWHW